MQPTNTQNEFAVPTERLPPSNIDAEEGILGGVLLDPEAMGRVADILTPEMFYLGAHQHIYRACESLYNQGSRCDLVSVSAWLNDQGELDKSGGAIKLCQLVDRTVSTVNIDGYAELVRDKWQRRRLIQVGSAIANLGHATGTSTEDVLGQAEQALFGVTQSPEGSKEDLVSISSILPTTFNELESRNSGRSTPGMPCGFYDLDAMTQGFQRSDLIIAAGRPAMGKTSFVLNVAHHIAITQDLPVVLYSLEMDKEQLTNRLLCGESGIESGRFRKGHITDKEWMPLANVMDRLDDAPLYICDNAGPSVASMRSHLRRMQSQHGQLGLVVIDYLQLMDTPGDNRVQGLSKLTRSLKQMARELNVPVIALSQLSRGVESRNNKRPMLSDLRESGSIEQDADLVLMLYRDEYYNPDTPDRGLAEISIAKHRNGPTGVVKLLFDAQYTRFRNLAK